MIFFDRFYLDKEHDIIVNLYRKTEDCLRYVVETPNHKTGNLITNLAKICNLPITKNDKDMKIIEGEIFAGINGDNKEVYILRWGGIKVANIYPDGTIEIRAEIPAINKTLMSQTKDYRLPVEKTLIKSYIPKRQKFRTDLHTHIHANLNSDALIALGIKHQIKYSLYYIKKLGLKLSDKQADELYEKRSEIEKKYVNDKLTVKELTRKVDDETFINFADLILNNVENMEENILKIRNSLVLMKDGQAVFTNLEKLYLYRYVFSKGKTSEERIDVSEEMVNSITSREVRSILNRMMEDSKNDRYANNTLLQDKLLWVARQYAEQGICYAEISVTWIVRKGEEGAEILQQLHEILPEIEDETGVKLRFLGSFSRTLMTDEQLKEGIDVLKVAARSPYIVGSDIIGEEINDIYNFKQVIKELVEYAVQRDDGFTIRIHAGENDSFRSNVEKAIECVIDSVPEGKKVPRCRLGHGLYGVDVHTKHGQEIIQIMKKNGVILEFQLTSNVRLNNLNDIQSHPIKKYLENGVCCVQGSDGCGFYGTDCMEEQMALTNLLNLSEDDLMKMKAVEDELMSENDRTFKLKSQEFEKWLAGRNIKDAILEEEYATIEANKNRPFIIGHTTEIESTDILKDKIITLPLDRLPIIIAGGSFNTKGRETVVDARGVEVLKKLVEEHDPKEAYFIIGHKMQGYEKALVDVCKQLDKHFDIFAIIPKKITKDIAERLMDEAITGVCVSIEQEELGIYKSFNYEIFERIPFVLVAFDGNSPVSNLVQEAKNGKAKGQIYINGDVEALREKADSLDGYVVKF